VPFPNGCLLQLYAAVFAGRQIPETINEERRHGILCISGAWSLMDKDKKDAPDFSAEDGTENTGCLYVETEICILKYLRDPT
jgi:hypothetical protein